MTSTASPPLAPVVAVPAAGAVDRVGSGTETAARGVLAGLGAYLAWGFIALFFKLVSHVPPIVVLSHRILWSAGFVALVVTVRRQWPEVAASVRRRGALPSLSGSTTMIAINWFVFLWAVSNKQVMQAGLGYFISPLVSVLLGILFLRERPRAAQVAALLLATAGVLVMVAHRGSFPWVALTLAWSFALYGLLRKTSPAGPLVGLFVETVLLIPLASFFVARFPAGAAAPLDRHTYALLASSGAVTAVPLILFATAARRVTMATLGFMQFLSPTCQLLVAIYAFKEPFTRWHLASFGLIWVALILYCLEALRSFSRRRETPAVADSGAVAVLPPD